MLNVKREDVKIFRSHLKENIMVFHPKDQVWKYKLQYFPEQYKVGYVMYCSNNIQMVYLTTKNIEVIEKENGYNIEIYVHLKEAFKMDADINLLYKNYNIIL